MWASRHCGDRASPLARPDEVPIPGYQPGRERVDTSVPLPCRAVPPRVPFRLVSCKCHRTSHATGTRDKNDSPSRLYRGNSSPTDDEGVERKRGRERGNTEITG
jgi:hypothetical protein